VDKSPNLVDKIPSSAGDERGLSGGLRPYAAKADSDPGVGSSGRPPLPGRQPLEASPGQLETLNAMTERELIRAYGGLIGEHRR